MNKAELIERIAGDLGVTKSVVKSMLDSAVLYIIRGSTAPGGVTIAGLGTFKTKHREARQGRNPRTGEAVDIPAHRAPKFVPAKGFKDHVQA